MGNRKEKQMLSALKAQVGKSISHISLAVFSIPLPKTLPTLPSPFPFPPDDTQQVQLSDIHKCDKNVNQFRAMIYSWGIRKKKGEEIL